MREEQDKPHRMRVKVVVGITVGVIVTGITLWSAWVNLRANESYRHLQASAVYRMDGLVEGIEAYRIEFGQTPETLDVLTTREWHSGQTFAWCLAAPYRERMHYTTDGYEYSLVYYGLSNEPGGTGIEYDLKAGEPYPDEALPTIAQFYRGGDAETVLLSCLMAGAFAGLIGFSTAEPERLRGWNLLWLGVRLVVTAAAAVFMALLLAAVHASGH